MAFVFKPPANYNKDFSSEESRVKITKLFNEGVEGTINVDDEHEIFCYCSFYLSKMMYSKFLRYIFHNVDKNNIFSMTILAEYFYKCKQYQEFIYYTQKTIDLGYIPAILILSNFYKETENESERIKILQVGVDIGDISSILNMGTIYYNKKNYQKAIEIWSIGATKDTSACYYNIGLAYNELKDINESVKYWLISAEKGHILSIGNIISYYEKENNLEKAIYWANKGKKYDILVKFIIKYFNTSCSVQSNSEFNGDFLSILSELKEEQFTDPPRYIRLILKLVKKKSDDIFTHLKYSPGSDGYDKCKKEFFDILSKDETLEDKVIREHGFVNNKINRRKSN